MRLAQRPEGDSHAQWYPVLHRPWALVQWLRHAAKLPEDYVLMAEPDHIFLRVPPLWCAQPQYASAWEQRAQTRDTGRGPGSMQPRPSPGGASIAPIRSPRRGRCSWRWADARGSEAVALCSRSRPMAVLRNYADVASVCRLIACAFQGPCAARTLQYCHRKPRSP